MTATNHFDVLIIGGGAAGYAAAIYARRYNLTVGLIEKEFGGYTALAGVIENYPGSPKTDGYELMQRMQQQAVKELGAVVISGEATLVKNEYHCFQVKTQNAEGKTEDGILQAKTLILATGMEHRSLNLPREEEYKRRGVHYCATCDGPVYNGKRIAVVGGGDAAVKSANQLADMGAALVFLVVRDDSVDRAEPVNRDRLAERVTRGNVVVIYETEVVGYLGGPPLEGIQLSRNYEGSEELAVSAVFINVGSIPRTELAQSLGVKLTERGEIDVEAETMKTNVDGVFAAGDVCDAAWGFKQTITSAAQGAIAATSAYKDISEHGKACEMHAMAVPESMVPAVL